MSSDSIPTNSGRVDIVDRFAIFRSIGRDGVSRWLGGVESRQRRPSSSESKSRSCLGLLFRAASRRRSLIPCSVGRTSSSVLRDVRSVRTYLSFTDETERRMSSASRIRCACWLVSSALVLPPHISVARLTSEEWQNVHVPSVQLNGKDQAVLQITMDGLHLPCS